MDCADASGSFPESMGGGSRGDSVVELSFALVCEWYGLELPKMVQFRRVTADAFRELWSKLWFAKGALQPAVDARLRKYEPLFCPRPPPNPDWSQDLKILYHLGFLLAYDQVSRNIYRGTPTAYATDSAALELCRAEFLPIWDRLPTPVRVSCILVFIHAEVQSEFLQHRPLLASIEAEMATVHPEVWAALSGIARNHSDRMQLFGRVPERNRILGRESSPEELAYLSAVKGAF